MENELLQYCKNGNLEKIKNILLATPTINISKEAFILACRQGHLNIARYLLEVNPSIREEEAFISACHGGHIDVVRYLLEIKPTINISDNNESAFRGACYNGHIY